MSCDLRKCILQQFVYRFKQDCECTTARLKQCNATFYSNFGCMHEIEVNEFNTYNMRLGGHCKTQNWILQWRNTSQVACIVISYTYTYIHKHNAFPYFSRAHAHFFHNANSHITSATVAAKCDSKIWWIIKVAHMKFVCKTYFDL